MVLNINVLWIILVINEYYFFFDIDDVVKIFVLEFEVILFGLKCL